MIKTTLYTYTHKYNKYPTYSVCAPDRNTANGMLTIWADLLPEYDGRNCDFAVTETPINVVTEEDEEDMISKALLIRGFWQEKKELLK